METVVKITIFGIFILVCALLTPAIAEVEEKHRDGWRFNWKWDDYEYERCPHSDYCTNYFDECNSDNGYKVRCNKCSFFQTCMSDKNNIKDPCDDTFICKDIEAFKQGKGGFAIMIILTCFLVLLSILSVCLCIGYMKLDKKLKKANNKSVRNAVAVSYPVKPSYNDVRDDIVSPPPPYRENEASAPPSTANFLASSMTFRNNPPTATAATTHVIGEDKGREE